MGEMLRRPAQRLALTLLALAAVLALPASALALGPLQATVAAAGDIVCDPDVPALAGECAQAQTKALVDAAGADRVLALGDLQYSAGSLNDFQTGYDLTWGALSDRTLPTPGNHEYLTAGAAGYFAYWGAQAGPERRGWYATAIGDWQVLSLNSNCTEAGGCGRDSAQGRWLAAELAASTATCQLAFWHHARFSSGSHGDTAAVQPLWELLEEHGVELVLSGHDHGYERFEPLRADGTASADGIVSHVVGTGGINLRDFATVRVGSEARVKRYGVLVLGLHADGWTEEFRATDGSVTGAGTTRACRSVAAPSATAPTAAPAAPLAAAPAVQSVARLRGLAAGASRVLPGRSDAGLAVRWSSRTPNVCRVARRTVAGTARWVLVARRAGTCWLWVRNAGADGYAPARITRTVRIGPPSRPA
jgi:hypothetical protein